MRDPKAHAKVLGLRGAAVYDAAWAANLEAQMGRQMGRASRLNRLAIRIDEAADSWSARTKWSYDVCSEPPRWVYTEIDTEEAGS